jgi:hypothetical protein
MWRLFCLGRQAGRRPAALPVDDDERQLGNDSESHRLGLQCDARPRTCGDTDHAAIRRPYGGTNCGNLVFGLERADTELS